MNQTIFRIVQAVSIVVLTAVFWAAARVEVTQTYFAAAVMASVMLTGFGTRIVQWLLRRRKGSAG